MAADESTEWLVDLLYADELEEIEDEHDAPRGADDDPGEGLSDAQLVELAGARAFLGEVRRAMPSEALSEEVRSSILSAAREAAAARTASDAAAERRPQVARTPSGSIWSRTQWSTIAQITSVAALLIVGAFSINIFQMRSADHVAEAPTATARMAADAAPSPAGAVAQQQRMDFPDAKLKQAAPDADGKTTVALKEQKPAASKGGPSEEVVQAAKADEKRKDEAPVAEDEGSAFSTKRARRTPSSASRAPAVAQAPADKKALSKNIGSAGVDDLLASKDSPASKPQSYRPTRRATGGFGSPEFNVPERGRAGAEDANNKQTITRDEYALAPQRAAESDLSAKKAADPATSTAKPAPEPKPVELADARPRPVTTNSTSTRSSTAPTMAPPAPKAATTGSTSAPARDQDAITDTMTSPKADPAPRKAITMSVSQIESAYKRRDLPGTLENANSFLGAGLGTNDERARAMELKAEALTGLGRGDEANRVLRELEQKYPGYAKKKGLNKKPAKNRVKSLKSSQSKMNSLDSF